jgi:hypothetical protein
LSENKTIITVPRNRQAELKSLYRQFLTASNRVDRLQVRRHQSMSAAAESLIQLMGEIDKLGTQFDWEESYIAEFKRNKVTIQNSTLKPESIQMETEPLSFIGYDRDTGEQLCRFEWDAKAELFRLTALTPTENKWSQEMAASVYRFLDQLNQNEELTRRARIRPAETEKP